MLCRRPQFLIDRDRTALRKLYACLFQLQSGKLRPPARRNENGVRRELTLAARQHRRPHP